MNDLRGKRAALYARYSTDMQNDKSVEDQFSELEDYARRHGIQIVARYSDREKTSATLHNRVGLWDMMEDARKGLFDMVLLESPSRLSRKTADLFRIKNSLEFRDIEIITLQQGLIDDTQATIHGLVGNEFLKQLRVNTRRGQKGRAREGKVICNHAYGYRAVKGRPGEPEIDPEKAEIVRRIFQEYIAGESPREIAKRLKAEGVPSPGRAGWSRQNILAGRSTQCRGGILANPIYTGRVEYGRTYKKFNPETGTRVNRRNTADDPVVTYVPQLRIISDEVWEAAHRVIDSRVRKPGGPRKPWTKNNSLLAGLCRCPCGAHMVVAQRGRASVPRIKCAAAHFRDECEHTKSYDLPRLEKAVRERLAEYLAQENDMEAKLEAFADQYRTRFRKQQRQIARTLESTRKRLREIEAATHRLISHIEAGTMESDLIRARLNELAVEKAALLQRESMAATDIDKVTVSPDALKQYREAIRILQEDLRADDLNLAHKMAFRNLVESITVLPTPARKPYEWAVNGRAAAIFGLDLYPKTESVDQMVRERGGPIESACIDSVHNASTARTISQLTFPMGNFVERLAA